MFEPNNGVYDAIGQFGQKKYACKIRGETDVSLGFITRAVFAAKSCA